MDTSWETQGDPTEVLNLLHRRLEGVVGVTALERSGSTLVVRSTDVPTWAQLLKAVLPPLPFKSLLLRARTDRVLTITATAQGEDGALRLQGDANPGVSRVLVETSHELFPEKVAAWDRE